ncbi:unnamed protein product [Lymnaea stagnalis]|uniref:NADH dehydrogenase [ubiquinone] 1 beta subcomplex subunit 4 n=1 Tax=Lymnaea stagnalis TaxID=6523 RepID=A0AAV2IED1_LYMST
MPHNKLWDPWKMFDVKPEELRAIKERAKMRQALKAEWNKKLTNPWKGTHSGGYLFDPAVQRFMAMKATQAERFKGTLKSAAIAFSMLVLPVWFLTHQAIKKRDYDEKRYRNGEVMYKDREKFF